MLMIMREPSITCSVFQNTLDV